MSRRLRPPSRRGQFFQLPLPQATSTPPPTWIPQLIAATSRKPRAPLVIRQGVFFSAPRGQRVAHPGDVRQRKRLPTLRRGAFFAVPFTQVSTAAVWIPQLMASASRKPRAPLTARRGVFLTAPLGQRMPHPSIMRRQKRALLSLKRGQFFTVPYALVLQTASWPAIMLRGARRPIAPIRRGVVFPVRLIGAAPVVTTRGVMSGVTGSGSTMSGVIGVGSTMSGV